MLNQVRTRDSTRKFLLLAAALCRRIWDKLPDEDCRRTVEAVERLADHPGVEGDDASVAPDIEAQLSNLRGMFHRYQDADPGPRGGYLAALACGSMWHDPDGMVES